MHIVVVGAGAWGTALALSFHDYSQHNVTLWTRFHDHAKAMEQDQENKAYFQGFNLPIESDRFNISSDMSCLKEANLLIWAVPAQYSVEMVLELRQFLSSSTPIILASKGILINPYKENIFLSQAFQNIFESEEHIYVLSGPNLAGEVAKGLPAATILAGASKEKTPLIAKELRHEFLRIYVNYDLIGTQIGGALKNIYAIGAGIVMGKNLGQNALASYLIRAFAELKRFANFYRTQAETLSGLAGMGDLILTATSLSSRNTSLGYALTQGKNLQEILDTRKSVSEGVHTVQAVYKLAQANNIRMPICSLIHGILFQERNLSKSIDEAMSFPPQFDEEFSV